MGYLRDLATKDRPEGFLAFIAVATLGELAFGWPLSEADRPAAAAAATVLYVVAITAALVVIRHGVDPSLAAAPAYLFFVIVALWRHADSDALSGALPLLALPVLWLALHGTLRQVWFSVGWVALVMFGPTLLIGAPDYPISEWRRDVLWVAVAALMGPLLHRQVRRLASQRALYQLLVDRLPSTAVGLVDRRLKWVTVAGRTLEESGLDPAGLVGKDVGVRVTPGSADQLRDLLHRGFDGPVAGVVESVTGQWYEIDSMPVQAEGRTDLAMIVARDITARHESEREREALYAAMARSEERFRMIFENAPSGIALTSKDGEQAGRFLQVNAAFATMLGHDREDLQGHLISEFTHPDDQHKTKAALHGVEPGSLEKRYLHTSGRSVWTEVSYTVLDDPEHEGRYFLTQVEDITTRKESERALLDALERQRQAVKSLHAAEVVRRDVISTISHELRTPLTSIAGHVELLVEGEAGDTTPEQSRMLEIVGRNTARLQRLVDDLLLLGVVDRASVAPDATAIRLDTLVTMAVDGVEVQATARGQRIERDIAPGCVVVGDRDQLDRAITNLLVNATKYTPDGGAITVTLTDRGPHASLSIADNGVGIPEAELPRLFERFFRASTAADTGAHGTGLGLAIVKSLVELNGGTVAASSTAGSGSVFTIELPLAAGRGAVAARRT